MPLSKIEYHKFAVETIDSKTDGIYAQYSKRPTKSIKLKVTIHRPNTCPTPLKCLDSQTPSAYYIYISFHLFILSPGATAPLAEHHAFASSWPMYFGAKLISVTSFNVSARACSKMATLKACTMQSTRTSVTVTAYRISEKT